LHKFHPPLVCRALTSIDRSAPARHHCRCAWPATAHSEIERELCSVTHAEIGAPLIAPWGLPG
jgi:hypothetical protein